jgi:hypothetical protein
VIVVVAQEPTYPAGRLCEVILWPPGPAVVTLVVNPALLQIGWSLGWVSAVDSKGRTIWIVDAYRDTGKRFVVRSDEMLSAFLELERIMHELALLALLGDDSN